MSYYTWRVRRQAISVGIDLKVNGKSCVSNNTQLKNNINFNGMNIGRGERCCWE